MIKLSASIKALPVLVACALAVNYPTIPADLTTPVQQRLAINAPNGEQILSICNFRESEGWLINVALCFT